MVGKRLRRLVIGARAIGVVVLVGAEVGDWGFQIWDLLFGVNRLARELGRRAERSLAEGTGAPCRNGSRDERARFVQIVYHCTHMLRRREIAADVTDLHG